MSDAAVLELEIDPLQRDTESSAPADDSERVIPLALLIRRGRNDLCDHCRDPILSNASDYHVTAQVGGQLANLHLHLRCFETWRSSS